MLNPTCHHCINAAGRPYGGFEEACRGCMARHASRSREFWLSPKAGRLTSEYRELLRNLGVTHDEARQAAADDWKKPEVARG